MSSERKNIMQPKDWWPEWERAASAKGLNLSEWIGEQCNQGLPKAVRESLSERVKQGRPSPPK